MKSGVGVQLARAAVGFGLGLFGLSILFYGISRLAPGGPCAAYLGGGFQTATQHASCLNRLGLHDAPPVQYFDSMRLYLRGDFGQASNGLAVATFIERVLPATVLLLIVAIVVQQLVAIPLGILAAMRRGSFFDRVFLAVTSVGLSSPTFWVGAMLLVIFASHLHVLPPGRVNDIDQPNFWSQTWFQMLGRHPGFILGDLVRHWVLPVIVLTLAGISSTSRLLRGWMITALNQGYSRAARANGLQDRTVIFRHALRNVLPHLLDNLAPEFAALLSGVVIVEIVFSWAGVGSLLAMSPVDADYATMQGLLGFGALSVVVVRLLADVASALAGAHIREDRVAGSRSRPGILGKRRGATPVEEHREEPLPRRLRRRLLPLLALGTLLLLALMAVFAPLISPGNGSALLPAFNVRPRLTFPWNGDWRYLLGTDGQGNTVLMWVAYGARTSLLIAALGAVLSAAIGVLLSAAALSWSWAGAFVSWCADTLLAVPLFPLLLLLTSYRAGGSWLAIALIFALVTWPATTRAVHLSYRQALEREFVAAAQAMGASSFRVMARHLAPALLRPVVATLALTAATIVTLDATIDFLSVGVKAPTVSWASRSLPPTIFSVRGTGGGRSSRAWRSWLQRWPPTCSPAVSVRTVSARCDPSSVDATSRRP